MVGDVISIETDIRSGQPLIEKVMQDGRRIRSSPGLAEIRDRATRNLEQLPESLRRLEANASYPVKVADALVALTVEVDRRLAEQEPAYV